MKETLKWMLYYDRQEIMDLATQQRLRLEQPELFPTISNVDMVTGIQITEEIMEEILTEERESV